MRRPIVCALALAAFAAASPSSAYYEDAHVTGDEAKVSVDTAGLARIEHVLSWQVTAGQYHSLDVGVEADARLEPDASLTAEDGRVIPATLVPREGGGARVTFAEAKGIKHGHYKVRLAYLVDLVAARAFARDGVLWRLTWRGPVFADGYDGARVSFVIPGSVDEPRPVDVGDGESADPGVLSTLRRSADRDELELVKPHVAKRELVAWTIRVAPRAFPGVRDPELRPPPAPTPTLVAEKGPPPLLLFGAALAAALAYAYVALRKAASFGKLCERFGASAGGVVGIRVDRRAALAGAAFGAGILLEAEGLPTAGATGIALAMLLAAVRAPRLGVTARGPGKWLAMRPDEAFPRGREGDTFDMKSLRAASALALLGAALAGLALALHRSSPRGPYLVALDAIALLPFFATGRRSQLPPDARSGAAWLRRVFARLSRLKTLKVVPWARVPAGRAEPDEVRVLVVPRVAMPGLVGIEVGLTWQRSMTSYAGSPGLLVRVHASSAASARMTTLAPFARPVPGRHPDERVFRLRPRLPTRDGTLLLVRRLVRELEDRRVARHGAWDRAERRVPPRDREDAIDEAA